MTDPNDAFTDYFASETHTRIFEIVFTETFNEAAAMATAEVGEDVNKAPGLFRAISKMQAYAAAAAAHFYRTTGLTQQGSQYFRGLADQIEAAELPVESTPAPAKKSRRK